MCQENKADFFKSEFKRSGALGQRERRLQQRERASATSKLRAVRGETRAEPRGEKERGEAGERAAMAGKRDAPGKETHKRQECTNRDLTPKITKR
jgi:hypothetical protein